MTACLCCPCGPLSGSALLPPEVAPAMTKQPAALSEPPISSPSAFECYVLPVLPPLPQQRLARLWSVVLQLVDGDGAAATAADLPGSPPSRALQPEPLSLEVLRAIDSVSLRGLQGLVSVRRPSP